ncbi:MAG: hypothetical protein CL612_05000 [Anaerolineaceae bacterium]|nr:hypothetical protein [Anaerolineaceae bacterium]|tara:strand:- start:1311 stop:3533 length:2223 start_codon:yes stop_codon:yes gene_type:complete
MNSGNDRSNNRVVPRWVVVLGILIIMGIVVYGLARIVLPMRQASNQQFSESSGEFNRGSGGRGRVGSGRGPFGFVQRLFQGGPSEEELVETGEVVLLDAERIIDASGTLIASQSGEIYWETSGIVAKVMVEVGDDVSKGDVLLELDPLSAPQNVIMAQADLISARKDLDALLNPTDLQISNAQKSVADAIEELDNIENPTESSVAQANQAVADTRDALNELKSPSAAQIAAAEQEIASKKDALRDQQEALDDLLNPDIEALQDALRDAKFDLARAEQDIELTDIGTATSALQNALDTLDDMKERQVSVQKAIDGCVVHKVEEEDDRDYMQLTVTEELAYSGYTYLVGPVYQVFEETGNVLKDTYGNIVEHQLFRICDSTRAVSVDGVTRTLLEANEDVSAAKERVREAELQVERTRMSNTTALDVAAKKVVDAQEDLDDALSGVDPIDQALMEADVQDAAGELAESEEDLASLLDPQVEDLAVAQGNLVDAEDDLELLLSPRLTDIELAKSKLTDAEEQLQELVVGPDEDDVAVAEAKVTAAQATLSSLWLEAPFDGKVVELNYLSGDSTDQSTPAVRLANTNKLLVEVSVDETEVRGVKIGQTASVTFDALSYVEVPALVTHIAPFGETIQGLVRYPVTVTLSEQADGIMLGMTSYVEIVTEVQKEALAVPIDAVQYDDEGEYLMVFNTSSKEQTRVTIESGVIQGDQVVVNGDLLPGQLVVIFTPTPTNSGSPFGGGR